MAKQIAPEVMDERLQRLQAAINRDQLAFNETSVGRACPVLIERKGKLPGQMLGKRSEEHTSELQSLMRISYAVFCLKKKKNNTQRHQQLQQTNHMYQNKHNKHVQNSDTH